MEAVFNDPADTLWRKAFNSIKNGIVDVPFSPHIINHNKVITLRDKNNNIRIIERGNSPIPDRCLEYERKKAGHFEDQNAVVAKIIQDIGVMHEK